MRKPKRSQARILLEHVWQSTNTCTCCSYERLNHSMHNALCLAIGSGMEFTKEDWHLSGFNPDRWTGETMETYYRAAVVVGNRSAIETYEAWIGRKPIIADYVNMRGIRGYSYGGEGGYQHGDAGTRKKERLVIGASFSYHGEDVEVTSFTKEGAAVCCSYKPREKDAHGYAKGPQKILHRYTVMPESIQADRAETEGEGQAD